MNRAGIYRVTPYLLTGVLLWACVHAGAHLLDEGAETQVERTWASRTAKRFACPFGLVEWAQEEGAPRWTEPMDGTHQVRRTPFFDRVVQRRLAGGQAPLRFVKSIATRQLEPTSRLATATSLLLDRSMPRWS